MIKTRDAARAFLLSPDNKIFMMQVDQNITVKPENPILKPYWVTPGGKIEEGETAEQTVRRELYEETGITDAIITLPHCWYAEIELLYKNERILFRDTFFVARAPSHAISTKNFTVEEQSVVFSHRWWSLEELRQSDEVFFPENFIAIVEKIMKEE